MTVPIILQEVARGQWEPVTPDDVPRPVTNWVEAMANALWWAEEAGAAIYARDRHGVTVMMLEAREAA